MVSHEEISKEKECFNCIQAALSFFCIEKGKKTEYLFSNCFGMEYRTELSDVTLSERMRPHITMDFKECYEQIYGICFKQIDINENKFVKEMSELTQESYVLVGFDAYYCTWNLAYKKVHFYHYCLVKSVNPEKKTITCIDPYLKKEDVEWSIELFAAGCKEAYLLKLQEHNESICWGKVKKILLHNLSKANICFQYDMLMEDLLNIRRKEELFEVNNPNICKVIIFSKQISKNYKGLLLMLRKIWFVDKGQIEPDCVKVIDKLFSQVVLWDKISLFFIKIMLVPELDKKMIEKLVCLINESKQIDVDILFCMNKIKCHK